MATLQVVKNLLCQIYDNADHILGTEAENHKEVAIQDAVAIKALAAKALAELELG